MNEDIIKLGPVKVCSWVSAYERKKNLQKIARVEVFYHDLSLICHLVKGKKDEKHFYYVSVPHWIFSKEGKFKKVNYINWKSKELSDEFQKSVKIQLFRKYPELFLESIE